MAFAGVDPGRVRGRGDPGPGGERLRLPGPQVSPHLGFYPGWRRSPTGFWQRPRSWAFPLISHLGPISKPLKSKYSRPIFLDAVVNDFPRLPVVGAHLGLCWWQELVGLIAAKETAFYSDISGWQGQARRNFSAFCHILRTVFDEVTAEKFLWGTDNPILEGVISARQWLQMIRDLTENAPDGLTLSREEIEALFGGNAAKIVGRFALTRCC